MVRVNNNLWYAMYRDLESQFLKMSQELAQYGVSSTDVKHLIQRLGYPQMLDFFDLLESKRYCDMSLYQFAVYKRVVRNHLKDIKMGLAAPSLFGSELSKKQLSVLRNL